MTGVISVKDCHLRVGDQVWTFAEENRDAIDAHWQQALARNPKYFNGAILLLVSYQIRHGLFSGELLRSDFKSVLYWRSLGFPETGVRDGFGSGLIRASDDGVLLAQQAAGHLNTGLAYLPGGFIDDRDIDANGNVDIAASVARELQEETGLAPPDITLEPGLIITLSGPHVSISVPYRSKHDSAALQASANDAIANDTDGELSACIVVRELDDLHGLELATYAATLLPALLENTLEDGATQEITWR